MRPGELEHYVMHIRIFWPTLSTIAAVANATQIRLNPERDPSKLASRVATLVENYLHTGEQRYLRAIDIILRPLTWRRPPQSSLDATRVTVSAAVNAGSRSKVSIVTTLGRVLQVVPASAQDTQISLGPMECIAQVIQDPSDVVKVSAPQQPAVAAKDPLLRLADDLRSRSLEIAVRAMAACGAADMGRIALRKTAFESKLQPPSPAIASLAIEVGDFQLCRAALRADAHFSTIREAEDSPVLNGQHATRLRHATIWPHGIVSTNAGKLLIYDSASRLDREFIADWWQSLYWSPRYTDRAVHAHGHVAGILDNGILATGRLSASYYHCLIESLADLLHVIENDCAAKNRPLIVDPRTPSTIIEAIEALVPGVHYAYSAADGGLFVKDLLVPTRTNTLIDSRSSRFEAIFPAPDRVARIRERALSACGATTNGARRVLIARSADLGRGITNPEVLIAAANNFALEIVDPSAMSFHEQVKLFSESELVVAQAGGALTNILFCPDRAKIISLVGESSLTDPGFRNLASVAGCEYTVVPCRQLSEPTAFATLRDFQHSPMTIDHETLGRELQRHG
jgi:capsular polysaccharide biosynthesis protein